MKKALLVLVLASVFIAKAGDKFICTTCGQTAGQIYTSGCRENQMGKHTFIINKAGYASDKFVCTTCGQTASQPYTSGCRENKMGKHTWILNK